MKKYTYRSNVWQILLIFFVVTLTCSCATLPPAQPIRDFKEVAGKWEGTSCTDGLGCSPVVTIFMEDGSGETLVAQGSPHFKLSNKGHLPVTRELVDGKIRITHMISGATGIVTIYEGEGKRLMVYKSDDGKTTATYKPVPK